VAKFQSYVSTVAHFNLPHQHLAPLLGVTLLEFCQDLQRQKTRFPGLSYSGIVCVILRLAVSVEHRLVTNRQTDTRLRLYGIYRASMSSRGKNRRTDRDAVGHGLGWAPGTMY